MKNSIAIVMLAGTTLMLVLAASPANILMPAEAVKTERSTEYCFVLFTFADDIPVKELRCHPTKAACEEDRSLEGREDAQVTKSCKKTQAQ